MSTTRKWRWERKLRHLAEETVNRSRFGGGPGREAADLAGMIERVRSERHADAFRRSAGSDGHEELTKSRPVHG